MNTENKFYVYLHRRATDNKVFYVGKGKDRRAYNTCTRNDHWKRVYRKHGLVVEIVFENLSEKEAFSCEVDTILEMKYFDYPLCNKTNGGEGQSGSKQSQETKDKRSLSMRGRKLSDEHKRKIGELSKTRVAGFIEMSSDNTVYHFLSKNGEHFVGTRKELCEKYNLNCQRLRQLFITKDTQKTSQGWGILYEGENVEEILFAFNNKLVPRPITDNKGLNDRGN